MITITVPIDTKLHAHNKGHWRSKMAAVADARAYSRLLTLGQTPIDSRAILDVLVTTGDKRRFDCGNILQTLKPTIDGVADSGGIVGDHWEALGIGSVEVRYQKGAAKVATLTFRPDVGCKCEDHKIAIAGHGGCFWCSACGSIFSGERKFTPSRLTQ